MCVCVCVCISVKRGLSPAYAGPVVRGWVLAGRCEEETGMEVTEGERGKCPEPGAESGSHRAGSGPTSLRLQGDMCKAYMSSSQT